MPRSRKRIAAADLVRTEFSADGERVLLTLAETDGGTVVLSLPSACLGEIVDALPPPVKGPARPVHSWQLEASGGGKPDLTLTLRMPDGSAVAFRVTPGQVAGMATLAAYGGLNADTARAVN